ncbi:hypothetical protein GH741_12380 [Aquibacillus halophilus]|uniref:Uncharacterized protein n=1 Tax=Aquibacillus halophilus TaxID=930132 RepID=A0A6A8DCQ0_9BACI|nr:hypothetical protein [Aquibacillus halophilus]MRH43475.1 hypothetical protein [Aquibacillus halophilus]
MKVAWRMFKSEKYNLIIKTFIRIVVVVIIYNIVEFEKTFLFNVLLLSVVGLPIIISIYRYINKPIEMVAYNGLTKSEQDRVPVSPNDSSVNKVTVDTKLARKIGIAWKGKEVYSVKFNHTATSTSGNLIVYLDLDKKTIVGKGTSHS